MKKSAIFLFVLSSFLFGCSQGPTGPQGPSGPGTKNVYSIQVVPSGYDNYIDVSCPAVNGASLVQAYAIIYGSPSAMPVTFNDIGGSHTEFGYSIGNGIVRCVWYNDSKSPSYSCSFCTGFEIVVVN